MGSACQHWYHQPTAELTFMETQTCNQGLINRKTCAFLTDEQLNLYRYAAGSNTIVLSQTKCNYFITDSNRTSLLHTACRCGSFQVVQFLINIGLDVNLADIAGWSPMHIAVTFDRVDVMKALIKAGANPYIKNKQNNTVFQQIKHDQLRELATTKIIQEEGVRELIEMGDFRSIRDIYEQKSKFDDQVSFGQSLYCETEDMRNSRIHMWSIGQLAFDSKAACPIENTRIYSLLVHQNPQYLSHLLHWKAYRTPQHILSHLVSVDGHQQWFLNFVTSNIQNGWHILSLYVNSKVSGQDQLIDKIASILRNLIIPKKNCQLAMLSEVISMVLKQKITDFVYSLLKQDQKFRQLGKVVGIYQNQSQKIVIQNESRASYDRAHLVRLDGQMGRMYTIDKVGVIFSDRLSILSKTEKGDYECWELNNGFHKRKDNISMELE